MSSGEVKKRYCGLWLDKIQNDFPEITTSWRLFVLTSSIGGLQIIWSTIISNVTPFLSSLGFSKSSTAIIWSISPICGALVQPYFGVLSDQSRNLTGRRKPFMLGGAIAISISLLGFALSESVFHGFLRLLGLDLSDQDARMVVKIIAILWFCLLNIAIQPLQVASRAFIIENCATDKQVLAHAWASRIQGVGSIMGLFLGSVRLPLILPYGGMPQFTTLCLVVSVLLLGTVLLSCFLVQEDTSHFQTAMPAQKKSLLAHIAGIVVSVKKMPRIIQNICLIQCFAWMGWFPFLMYYTTYVSGTYKLSNFMSFDRTSKAAENAIQIDAMRLGSLAGLLLAVIALNANCTLPIILEAFGFVKTTKKELPRNLRRHDPTEISNVSLAYTWMFAHVYFTTAMFLTFFVTSQIGSMLLVASVGISWAITLWVPYSLVGVVLSKQQELAFDDVPEVGVVMGLYNAAISAPQILSALICSIVFAAFNGSDVGVTWALRVGGCWAVVAAVFSWKLIRELSVS